MGTWLRQQGSYSESTSLVCLFVCLLFVFVCLVCFVYLFVCLFVFFVFL